MARVLGEGVLSEGEAHILILAPLTVTFTYIFNMFISFQLVQLMYSN